MARSAAVVDRGRREVIAVSGPDRLSWLHLLLTQHVSELPADTGTEALVLDANGRVLPPHGPRAHRPDTCTWTPSRARPPSCWTTCARWCSGRRWSSRDATAELAVLSVVGPADRRVLAAAGVPVPARPRRGARAARRRAGPADALARRRRGRPAGAARRAERLVGTAGRGRRPPGRRAGLRGDAGGGRAAPAGRGHRRPDDPARGRLDRLGRAPDQGLLPRPGDGGPGGEPRAGRPAGWCCCTSTPATSGCR